MKKEYALGNDAIAYGLLEGGIEAAFAYPGTPSSEITEKLIELSGIHGFYTEWSVNEKSAYENAYGVSLTGRRAAVIMKHVGLNVASDAFITSAYTGITGGLVLIVADDPYAHSSQNEQDSRRYASLAKIPCLEPSSVQEAKEMASFAFSLSEEIGLPVMLRSVTRISHGKSDVVLGEITSQKRDSEFKKDPSRFVMVPSNARAALKRLNEKQPILKIMEELPFNKTDGHPSETGIVASGISWQYIKELQEEENLPFALFKAFSLPLPENRLSLFIKNRKRILVLEEGDSVIEEKIRIIAQSSNIGVFISGKMDGIVPQGGELSADLLKTILNKFAGREEKRDAPAPALPLSARMPVLCPGCSHMGSFHILKKVFGREAVFPGDIGCYTLGVQSGTIDTCLCMGGGINTGSGISRFEKKREVISIIGDSTFFHAGITGLLNACYNKANQIIAVLDNRTTAMTGHQPHPGTGETASGEKTIDIDIEKIAYACGAEKVVTIDPYRIKESIQKLKPLKGKKGVRVIIAKRGCIFVDKRKKGKFYVDAEKCTECKACMQINCPAIIFRENKAEISVHCTGCGICAEICPAGAIKPSTKV